MLRERDDTKRYPSLGHQHELDKKERDYEAERAAACRKSEQLRAEINANIRDGEDPAAVLLKAIECISLMTGDAVFNTQNRKRLRMNGSVNRDDN